MSALLGYVCRLQLTHVPLMSPGSSAGNNYGGGQQYIITPSSRKPSSGDRSGEDRDRSSAAATAVKPSVGTIPKASSAFGSSYTASEPMQHF